ncbi:unnamed protein product, partial [Closterium sp. NIES-54]
AERPRWAELLRSGVAIFDLDYDAMHALSVSAEGDSYLCVPLDPAIEAAALGASESALPGTAPAEALHTFTLDSGASRCFFRDSTTLTPLSAPVPVRLADPSGGPVLARSSNVLPCPAVPSGSLSSLHLPSFSTNLVSTAALLDAMVTTTTPGGQRVLICTCTRTGRDLATFTRRPGSSLYTLATEPPQHQTLLWHHRLVTPPCHASVACTPASLSLAFSGLYLPSRPAFLASRGGSAPLLTPPRFPRRLLPCRISTWTFRLHLRERFREDLPVLRLHSDRGGEFSSDLLRDFFCGEGILQSFTLPDSPKKNGIAERHIGLVMEVARTSMIHVTAPHFLWPFAPSDATAPVARGSVAPAARLSRGASYSCSPEVRLRVRAVGLSVESGHELRDGIDGMWIFKVKRPPGSPPMFKSPPHEWHDTLCTILADLGFRPSSADPSMFVRRGSTPFFILVYVDDLVVATADTVSLAEVKFELQKRHTYTDLGELHRYLGLQITRDRAARTITPTQSHMVQQVLQRFGLHFSTTQPTPLPVNHRLTGPFPDEPFESNGPYAELVGCLISLLRGTASVWVLELCRGGLLGRRLWHSPAQRQRSTLVPWLRSSFVG